MFKNVEKRLKKNPIPCQPVTRKPAPKCFTLSIKIYYKKKTK